MTDTLDALLVMARRRQHATGSASLTSVVESLVFTKRWEASGYDPEPARPFPFRLEVDTRGRIGVTVHGRDVPIDAGDLRRRFREAGVDLSPGLRLLLTPELAGEMVDGALGRITRAAVRSDWDLASLNLRLSFANAELGLQIRSAIGSVERSVIGMRRKRVVLTAARAALQNITRRPDAA